MKRVYINFLNEDFKKNIEADSTAFNAWLILLCNKTRLNFEPIKQRIIEKWQIKAIKEKKRFDSFGQVFGEDFKLVRL